MRPADKGTIDLIRSANYPPNTRVGFRVVVADEAHDLKDAQAKCSLIRPANSGIVDLIRPAN